MADQMVHAPKNLHFGNSNYVDFAPGRYQLIKVLSSIQSTKLLSYKICLEKEQHILTGLEKTN